jgi:hypothetical protein
MRQIALLGAKSAIEHPKGVDAHVALVLPKTGRVSGLLVAVLRSQSQFRLPEK